MPTPDPDVFVMRSLPDPIAQHFVYVSSVNKVDVSDTPISLSLLDWYFMFGGTLWPRKTQGRIGRPENSSPISCRPLVTNFISGKMIFSPASKATDGFWIIYMYVFAANLLLQRKRFFLNKNVQKLIAQKRVRKNGLSKNNCRIILWGNLVLM